MFRAKAVQMVLKSVERCSASLIIKYNKWKWYWAIIFISQIARLTNLVTHSAGEAGGRQIISYFAVGKVNKFSPWVGMCGQIMLAPFDSPLLLLGIYAADTCVHVEWHTCKGHSLWSEMQDLWNSSLLMEMQMPQTFAFTCDSRL